MGLNNDSTFIVDSESSVLHFRGQFDKSFRIPPDSELLNDL